MRSWTLIALALFAAVPRALMAATPFDGVWLFDASPDYPGVTMMEVKEKGGSISGEVTTRWYGPIPMQDPRIVDGELVFQIRNLNDKEHATRTWEAILERDGRAKLKGDIWYAHVEQTGVRGTKADAKRRRFHYAELAKRAALDWDGLAKSPPMGWSSWNKFEDRIDDKTIREIADAMVSTGLRDAGYIYVNIDDGWQGTRGPDGEIRPNERFKDMKALADYLHTRGLKLGIYTSPGPKSCAGYGGSYGHVDEDARTFARWGVDYVKYDLCSGEWFYADAQSVKRAYLAMGAALRATGRPIIYSLCEYGRFDVGSWGRQVGGHLWRVSGDINDTYASMALNGFDKAGSPENSGPGGWNDPDMLEIGNGGMSVDEYRTHMTLWAMSSAPLIMGHDVRKSTSAALELLTNREVIAIDQDKRGAQGRRMRGSATQEVWAKPLADGSVAIALFNRADSAAILDLRPSDGGFGAVIQLRDLWAGRDLAPETTSFTVPPHGAFLLKASGR